MELIGGKVKRNEVTERAFGGTELQLLALHEKLGEPFLEDFQIVASRVRELDQSKIRVLYQHDLPHDMESEHLDNEGWRKFHKIVFVSHWQQQKYIERYNIPWSHTVVLKNAIDPIDVDLDEKYKSPPEQINFVYHTTPHRGLRILVPVFSKIAERHDNVHLHVYSSFEIYGWEKRNEDFEALFDQIKNHDKMTYHGFKPNNEVKEALKDMHVFAYPSIHLETFCIALVEAMSAGCVCIHPNQGALYETAANWTFMYNYIEDINEHANQFYHMLDQTIGAFSQMNDPDLALNRLKGQKSYTDLFYSWDLREMEWKDFLNSLRDLPREIPQDNVFDYRVSL
jgi:UDP-glucose:(glucosyl)LPS alpha-1,2-glucosyltransferase